VPSGPGVLLARTADTDTLFTSVTVREEDRKLLWKREQGMRETGTRETRTPDLDEYFDTLLQIRPLRVNNGYAIIDPGMKAKSVDVKIEFDPGATVKLNVTDPDGKPLAGVTMVGHGLYGERVPTFPTAEIAVGGLAPKGQPQQLYLLHKERKLCAGLQVKGDEKGPIAVKMQPCAAVTGRVVDHNGKPMRGARVAFQPCERRADNLLRVKLFRDANTVMTDTDGRFAFAGTFPDVEFYLSVWLPGINRAAAPSEHVVLKPGEVKDIEFRLPDPKKRGEE
jgi:protocatechuate 3,4-dioxygenase beta subunit